jgi:hypothetical protein
MTTQDMLNQLGLNEEQFYALYPTEAAFKKANPQMYKMLKGGEKPKPQYTGQPTESQFFDFGELPQGPIGFYQNGGSKERFQSAYQNWVNNLYDRGYGDYSNNYADSDKLRYQRAWEKAATETGMPKSRVQEEMMRWKAAGLDNEDITQKLVSRLALINSDEPFPKNLTGFTAEGYSLADAMNLFDPWNSVRLLTHWGTDKDDKRVKAIKEFNKKKGGMPCFECGGYMQAGGDTTTYMEKFFPNQPVMMGSDSLYRTNPATGESVPVYKDFFSRQETFDPRAKKLIPITAQPSPEYRKVGPGFFQEGGTQGFTSEDFQQRPVNNLLKFTNAAAQKAILKQELEDAFANMNPSMMRNGGSLKQYQTGEEVGMMGPENFNYEMFFDGARPTRMPIRMPFYQQMSDEEMGNKMKMGAKSRDEEMLKKTNTPGLESYLGDLGLMNLDFYTNIGNADERKNYQDYLKRQSSAENSFNTFGKGSRGDYYTNMSAGTHFRPDDMNPYTRRDSFQLGGEYEMSDEEIEQFLAMGGKIEYLD